MDLTTLLLEIGKAGVMALLGGGAVKALLDWQRKGQELEIQEGLGVVTASKTVTSIYLEAIENLRVENTRLAKQVDELRQENAALSAQVRTLTEQVGKLGEIVRSLGGEWA